jgi:hypothetical protein
LTLLRQRLLVHVERDLRGVRGVHRNVHHVAVGHHDVVVRDFELDARREPRPRRRGE